MPVPQEIFGLVGRFENNREAYRSGQYNETQLRREFVDPFFKILGWDVNNEKGYAEAYKDVIHEDSIKVGGVTKAPDYCFRIGGTRKFFVETKKPSVNLKDDISPAFQLRRYAWSAKLPLSILTDFEEFAVYDCRAKPDKSDKASTARILYLNCNEYAQRWDEIFEIFSRDAVLKGSFDRYAESSKVKKGTASVDDAFLKEIESWRDTLARNLALRNPDLTQHDLNFTVQRTIDRIVFLRICEDRGMEQYGRLMSLQNGDRAYTRLCEMFQRADERYNSGLFHFQKDKGRAESPDTLTLNLTIDDSVLKNIIKNLYYPDSPYEFSVISADILGQVYEQFLGKVIRLTAGHRAIVEEKPEVRKAGGVYYTPTYIVDYIVKNTVGKFLECGLQNDERIKIPLSKGGKGVVKSPLTKGEMGVVNPQNPKSVSKLKILDPACGSGSFLLGAYQYLLDWHGDWYVANDTGKWATGRSPALYQAQTTLPSVGRQGGAWRLTTAERRRILLNNIYGVDIDPQAVEVTKLSLLLKVLEGETEQTITKQLKLFHERALPDLGSNIKCGNSLIGTDFYDINVETGLKPVSTVGDEERRKINPFDWKAEFPEIIKPAPAGREQGAGGFDVVIGNPPWGSFFGDLEKEYLSEGYINRRGEAESHLYFIEKGFHLLKETGILGFITPNTWLSVLNSREIREYLLTHAAFYEITELSKYIFKNAPDIVPILVFLKRKNTRKTSCIVKRASVIKVHGGNFNDVFSVNEIPQDVWQRTPGTTINLRATPTVLQVVEKCKTKAIPISEICEVLYGIKTGNNEKYLSTLPSDKHKVKALKSGELARYHVEWNGVYLWWCTELAGYRTTNVEISKIIVQYIRKLSLPRRIIAALDAKGTYYPLNNYSYITLKEVPYSLKYVLGILNSTLINFYFANTFIDYNIKPTYLQQIPIHTIDFSDTSDKARHDRIVVLVDQMLDLHKQLTSAKTDHDKTIIQRQADATDRQIDQLVYELYGLAEEEIKIVEEGSP